MITKVNNMLIYLLSPFVSGDNLIIVTGADSSHYRSLCRLLSSLLTHEPTIKTIVFDLGLTKSERQYIQETFLTVEIRLFDYSSYPDYFDITVNAGQYAWKPVILDSILNEFKDNVCWMDAGNLVIKPLSLIRKIIKKVGLYSPSSAGKVSDWTHPKTLEFLKASKRLLNKRNLNGACVAVAYEHKKARNLIRQWRQCALTKACIAPEGSSRKNHRQDQAVLSVIAHQANITKNMPSRFYGYKVHQDID